MTMPLSPIAYAELLKEDIKWLEKIPYCLEQGHIIAVLKEQLEKTGYSDIVFDNSGQEAADRFVADATQP